jgi:hypothetical protein
MSEHPTALAVVRAYVEAWTNHDIATAAGYLAEDMVFDGPITHAASAEEYVGARAAWPPSPSSSCLAACG